MPRRGTGRAPPGSTSTRSTRPTWRPSPRRRPISLAWHERALALAAASADPRARRWRGSLYHNLGWTYLDAGRPGDALAAFEAALACREEAGRLPEVRLARWAVARALRAAGRVAAALAAQQALLAEAAALGAPDGYVCEEIGECLLALGRAAEARPYFARAAAALAADLAGSEPDRLARLRALGAESDAAPA